MDNKIRPAGVDTRQLQKAAKAISAAAFRLAARFSRKGTLEELKASGEIGQLLARQIEAVKQTPTREFNGIETSIIDAIKVKPFNVYSATKKIIGNEQLVLNIKTLEKAGAYIRGNISNGCAKFVEVMDASTASLSTTKSVYLDLLKYADPAYNEERDAYEKDAKKIALLLLIKLLTNIKTKYYDVEPAKFIQFLDTHHIGSVVDYLLKLHRSNT